MSNLTIYLIVFIVLFIVIFLIECFFVNRKYFINSEKKKKRNKKVNSESTELYYMIKKFDLDINKLSIKKLMFTVSIINSFIISFTSVILMLIDINIILRLAIGFILLIALIYSLYEILGRFLIKKGYDKNGN